MPQEKQGRVLEGQQCPLGTRGGGRGMSLEVREGGEGVTEDEMVGRHHRLNGHELEQIPGDGGVDSLACSLWGHRVGHNLATEQPQTLAGRKSFPTKNACTNAGPRKRTGFLFTLGFLRVLATILSCPKDPNCFLTGFTISSLVFLLSIHNTTASGVLLKLKVLSCYSSPQTLCGLQVYAKEEPKSSPHPPRGSVCSASPLHCSFSDHITQ